MADEKKVDSQATEKPVARAHGVQLTNEKDGSVKAVCSDADKKPMPCDTNQVVQVIAESLVEKGHLMVPPPKTEQQTQTQVQAPEAPAKVEDMANQTLGMAAGVSFAVSLLVALIIRAMTSKKSA
jgi:hypothetical protein